MPTAVVIAAVLIAAAAVNGVSAQLGPASSPGSIPMSNSPSAAAPTPDCLNNLLNMSDCLSYVQAGSGGASKPDKACCPELAGLVESAPQCLCHLLGGNVAEQYGFKVDMAKALKLPAVCRVETPPPSMCSLFGVPVAAPVANGGSSPISSPSSSLAPGPQTPGGFAAGPSTGDSKNNARCTTDSGVTLIFTVFSMFFSVYIFH